MAEAIISKLSFLLSNRFLNSSSSTSTWLNPSQCIVSRSGVRYYSPLKNSGSKQQIILSCSQHDVLQSQEEANKKIHNASPRQYAGVGCETDQDTLNNLGGDCRKKRFFVSLILVAVASDFPMTNNSINTMAAAQDNQLQQTLETERYTDANEGFTLLKPSSWMKVEKAGATVLFEDTNKKNNLGIVVSPVRLSSLGDFGSPEFVADKLIQAEKRKESIKDAKVIGVAERLGHGGLQVYEFEYMLDSARGGVKRIFSAAFVASKKLYLLNIAYTDPPENPLNTSSKMILEQVLHSFDTAAAVETM
ncbi:psbP domain-containing protein 2, chloroplastic-like [Papaver somniferum]|nr:psbP domain-containing protein 2, chloroplastic-like [Papaver somniferum]XP_026406631.1 psbP domain-containing protein 2, chloroplastic-like [Papaver somniferum]XP_026406633.1 psbP domain-containing protein 2, chloroplastic-like [Papaver somniferum]XP_026406634.1 psbP domain-containing protein 2, chloroplastic-like [Papaver somniferum]